MLSEFSHQTQRDFKSHKWLHDGLQKKQEIKDLELNRTQVRQEINQIFCGMPKATFKVQGQQSSRIQRELTRYTNIGSYAQKLKD